MMEEIEFIDSLSNFEIDKLSDAISDGYERIERNMKDEIILYTTHCPLCKGVESLLKSKNIDYKEVTDVDEMLKLKINHVPVLSVNGDLYFGADIYKKLNH